MTRTKDDEILEKLDQILRVLALQAVADKSITEGVRLLQIAGLDNRTIANVLNMSDTTVRVVMTNLRRPRSSSKKRQGG